MKVTIREVVDFGTHDSERIVLDVNEDTDIGEYFVLDTTYTARGKVSNKVRHPYWFPDLLVVKGDVIVLYTKKGETNNKLINSGHNTMHFYYWGLSSSVWNDDGDCALLVHADQWTHKKANE